VRIFNVSCIVDRHRQMWTAAAEASIVSAPDQ